MILYNARLIGKDSRWNVQLRDGKIVTLTENRKEITPLPGESNIDVDGALVLPGFINSHDHLDFNLFPRLGNRTYSNYKEWGPVIQKENTDIINEVERIPQRLRIKWGLYKNLLNGFTTVVNHGDKLEIEDSFIRVFQDYYPIHSPGFEKNWKWKLNHPFKRGKPIVMHLGEGTDAAASDEIDQVRKLNMFRKKIIAVHGVAMTEKQAGFFPGLVWCPASNYFLLDKTAAVDKLKDKINIVFGTDSTLTSSWNAWEHFRIAEKNGGLNNTELLDSLTINPATLWKLPGGGEIKVNCSADIIVVKKTDHLFSQNPEDILLVIQNGTPRLIDESLSGLFKEFGNGYSEIRINNSVKKVEGNLPGLVSDIKKYYPAASIPFSFVHE